MKANAASIDAANRLLRGEISAVEAYALAIDKFGIDTHTAGLQSLQSIHAQSVGDLQSHIIGLGAEPDRDAGAWGILTTSIQTIRDFFGKHSALTSLIDGEEHGVADYQRTLEDAEVSAATTALIRDTLLPRLERNLATLRSWEPTV